MSKPTPGPYQVVIGCDSAEVTADNHRITIASFHADWCDEYDRLPKAEANARAWVEGQEAVATLERIRTAMASVSFGQRALEVRDVVLSIIEAKP